MSFPDMKDLEHAARVWQFRSVNENETEAEYRTALADHVNPKSSIESMEIRTGHGWDEFTPEENMDLLVRVGLLLDTPT